MSLLMDALKRAESSKQEAARQQADKSPAPAVTGNGLSLAPLEGDTQPAPGRPLPDLATHIEAVDADLARAAQPQTGSAPSPAFAQTAASSSQASARNAFAAKQVQPARARTTLWLALGVLLAAGAGIAGYVWFQMNTMGGGSLSAPIARTPPPTPVPAVPAESLAAPALPANAPPAASVSAAPANLPTEAPPQRVQPAARNVAATAPIRLARTQPAGDPALSRGHSALQEGRLEQASQQYLLALQHDPNNVDALLALAAIAQHQGRGSEAEGWRQRALVADPSHPAAQAAVLGGTAAGTDPLATESRLKTLLAAQPQSAELNFTLGNLFASQRRWSEAQQAYFNAVAADGDNPDYLFNLAVSLDQMRQPRPAAQHYRLALEAAIRRPAAFDTQQARRRLVELAP